MEAKYLQIGYENTTTKYEVPLKNTFRQELGTKQDLLVSGTSIKTINGSSILGPGNIEIATQANVDNKQDKLVSGVNIKTVNGYSLLGGGNLELEGGGGQITIDSTLSSTSTNPVQNKVVTEAVNKKLNASTDFYSIEWDEAYKALVINFT